MLENGSASTEVLVVGGGPTGLCAALALGRLGVGTIVLERRQTVSTHPRGHVENGRTMELFRLWGIEREVREQGLPREFLASVAFMTRFAGISLGEIRFHEDAEWVMGHEGKGPAALSSTPQDRLEPILLREVGEHPSVSVRFATEVVSLESRSDGVRATVRGPDGGHETLEASYAIAADGPRSPVRESLEIGVDGPGTLGAQLGIYFHADLSPWVADNPNALYWLYNPDVQGVVISLDGDRRWHLLFAYDPDRESVEDYPPERCESIVRELIGDEKVEIDIRSVLPWRMRAAVARRFRSDRVFLAGDAAHLNPPWGGHGFNTGVGDAVDLGWKLAAVLSGWGGSALLDGYEAERRPVHRRVIREATTNMRTLSLDLVAADLDAPGEAGEEARQRAAERIYAAKTGEFHSLGLVLGYRYEGSPLVADEGTPPPPEEVVEYHPTARPGARLPHAWLGSGRSLFDELGTGFSLLRLGPRADPGPLVAASKSEGVPLEVVDLARENLRVRYEADLVLVRPDQHVAWRGDAYPDDPAALVDLVRGER